VPGNVARVLNLTQRDYAHMRPGPGFRGSLRNVDLSGDPNIDHLNIDKSPRLHARVIAEVLAIVGSHRIDSPTAAAKPLPASLKTGAIGSGSSDDAAKPVVDGGTPVIAAPERTGKPVSVDPPASAKPAAASQ
jgi:hypothetical protein